MAKGLVIEKHEEKGQVFYTWSYRSTTYHLFESQIVGVGAYKWSLWSQRKGLPASPPRCFDTLAEVEAVAKGFAGLAALIGEINTNPNLH